MRHLCVRIDLLTAEGAGSDPTALLHVARQPADAADRLDAHIGRSQSQFRTMKLDWSGSAADAAQKQGREMFDDQVSYRDSLRSLAGPLGDGATDLCNLRIALDSTIDEAERWWDVGDDGSVQPGLWLSRLAAVSWVYALLVEARRIPIECDIKLIIAQFEALDRNTGYAVRKIGWDLP